MLGTLRREEAKAPELLDDLEVEVFRKAADSLGYSQGRYADATLKQRAAASKIFAKTKIRPFSTRSVNHYKALQRMRTSLKSWLTLGFPVVLLGLYSIKLALVSTPSDPASFDYFMGGVGFCVGGAFLLTSLFSNMPVWRTVTLRDFAGEVPTFALLTATTVNDLCLKEQVTPHFTVEFLATRKQLREEREAMRRADPFLVVVIGDQKHYIEVWEEPGFNRKRKV